MPGIMSQRYTDAHRKLIQAMLSNPVSTEEEMLKLYNMITGSNCTLGESKLSSMVKEVNNEVKRFHMEIKKQICEVTETTFYTLISLFPSPEEAFEKAIQIYSPAERSYFRLVVEEIVNSEERCINRNFAMNLTQPSTSQASQTLGPNAISKVLDTLLEDRWLIVGESGELFLAARAIAELEHLLTKTYDVESCKLCGNVCVLGFRCQRESCGVATHSHCQKSYDRRTSKQQACPTCSSKMKHI